MTRLATIAGCLLAASATLVGWQRSAIMKAQQESEKLREENQAFAQQAEELRGIPESTIKRQDEMMPATTRELLRLRNDVRQYREQARELEKLRQENEHLASVLKALASGKAPRLAEMDGYVAREAWSNSGLGTPEAALQTFFWALQEGNVERILDCMNPELRVHFERSLGQDEASRRKSMSEAWGPLLQIAGFRISNTEQPSENEVVLGIQAAASGAVVKMSFKRVGEEWKFADVGPGN